jgi:polysaccharide export outer membrane protein
VRVSEEGTITLPLLGQVIVGGRTREDVEREIARRLAEGYVKDPQVTVFVREFQSRKVTVSGAVNRPGSYAMLGPRTLLEMIAEAGGLTDEVGQELYVVRGETADAERDRIPIDLESLLYQGDHSLNIDLRPGDIVYAPFEEMVDIYVNGAVRTPGAYEFKRSERVTVLQAVTRAGGVTERASEKKLHVIRKRPDGSKVILPVNLRKVKQGKDEDIELRKDDIVVVPESFF